QAAPALPVLRRGLELAHPGDFFTRKLYGQLARGHHLLGQRAEALAVCQTGQAYCPDDAELLFLESLLWRELGDDARAEACLLRLVQPGARFVAADLGLCGYKARHNLALLCCRQGRVAEAETHWRAALAEEPGFEPARRGLAELGRARSRRNEPARAVEPAESPAPAASRRMTVSLCMIVRDEEACLA